MGSISGRPGYLFFEEQHFDIYPMGVYNVNVNNIGEN